MAQPPIRAASAPASSQHLAADLPASQTATRPRSPAISVRQPAVDRFDWLRDQPPPVKRRVSAPAAPLDRGSHLPDGFATLFTEPGRTLREDAEAWWPCLPPLALELAEFGASALPDSSKVIGSGAGLGEVDSCYGRSVLHWACLIAHPDTVRRALAAAAREQIDARDLQGRSPLASVHALRPEPGGAEVIEALLLAGASLDGLPHRGVELLYRADLSPSLARLLLQKGVDVNGGGTGDLAPLMQCCERGLWPAASVLLDFGADVRRRGPIGLSVLHHPQLPLWLAERLRRLGADVNARDQLGETPLMAACAAGALDYAGWLVDHGARLDAVSLSGSRLPAYAAQGGEAMAAWLATLARPGDDNAVLTNG